jgi:hypothetical protein
MLLLVLAFTAACASGGNAPPPADRVADAAGRFVPRGAIIEPSGYATILEAPPAPFTPAPPGAPRPPTPEQIAAHQRFARVAEFQRSVMDEVTALAARLRREQAGNFVDLYYDNEGEPRVVFQFLRDGAATLDRYTRHPRFAAETVRFTQADLEAASAFMWRVFGPDRVLESSGIAHNRVDVRVSVTEAEFQALVRRKGVTLPEAVRLDYAATRPAAEVNAPLPAAIASLVRVFPRDDRPLGILHSINSTATVVLRDGCFRTTDTGGALVLFPLGAQLFVDAEGYLAFGSGEPGYGRVGETLIFPGSIGEVTAPALVDPIHAACGPGRVIKINGTASAAAHRSQQAVTQNAQAVQLLRESYGLSQAAAERAAARCAERSGMGVCLFSPPPPVERQADCPAGTRLSFGLCRTPEGYVRPLPEWLREFVEE